MLVHEVQQPTARFHQPYTVLEHKLISFLYTDSLAKKSKKVGDTGDGMTQGGDQSSTAGCRLSTVTVLYAWQASQWCISVSACCMRLA